MTHQSHVILMGLRGSGKSTVGRLVARDLGRRFVDLDDRTPALLGKASVAAAWAAHGEPAFRAAERAALEAVLAEPPAIIALGGGTPTAPGAAELLREHAPRAGMVVYLRATPQTLAARLASTDNSHRPSLTGKPANSIEEIRSVFAQRDEVYRALATEVVEVDGRGIDALVAAVRAIVQG